MPHDLGHGVELERRWDQDYVFRAKRKKDFGYILILGEILIWSFDIVIAGSIMIEDLFFYRTRNGRQVRLSSERERNRVRL